MKLPAIPHPSLLAVGAGLALAACSGDNDPAAAGAQKPRNAFADYKNIQVFYKDVGQGDRAVVLVHGWAGDHTVWQQQEPALTGKVRTILVDLPGHGNSSKPPNADYSMDLFAAAIDQVLRECRVRQAVLVGHSNGGIVALQFQRRFPQKTLGVVTVESMLRQEQTLEQVREALAPFRGKDYQGTIRAWLDQVVMASKTPDQLKKQLEPAALEVPRHVLLRSAEEAADPVVWQDLRVTVPLLVVNLGYWPKAVVEHARGMGKDVTYRTVEGASHFLMLDRPDEFNRILLEFLQKLGLVD